MKRKRTPTVEEVDDKLHEIAYGQPPKRPWPRSAKITVWVLAVIIAVSVVVNIIAITQWYDAWEKWNNFNNLVY